MVPHLSDLSASTQFVSCFAQINTHALGSLLDWNVDYAHNIKTCMFITLT